MFGWVFRLTVFLGILGLLGLRVLGFWVLVILNVGVSIWCCVFVVVNFRV